MERVYNLTKGSCKGKIAAITSITTQVSFKSKGIRNIILRTYQQYLQNYCGYDKVYILSTKEKPEKIDNDYFDESTIVFDITKENILNDLKVDDVFNSQVCLVIFGGVVKQGYFILCKRLVEWYKVHGNGHYYTIQDDPEFFTINPLTYYENRFNAKNLKYDETSNTKAYFDMKLSSDFELLNECFDNSIVAHCGTDYELFFSVRKNQKMSTNVITEPKWWDCFNVYTWQGVNCNLEEKLKDYDFPKKFKSEYHGYVKTDLERIKTTVNFYNALESQIKVIQSKSPFSKSEKYQFKNTCIFNEVKYNDLFEELSKDSCSSFITATKSAFNDFISPRYFDLMLMDVIPFVYLPYDKDKKYTNDEELKEFMYVETPEEFKEKVEKIYNDEKYYRHIKYLQRKSIYDKFNDFMSDKSKSKFEEYLENNKQYILY